MSRFSSFCILICICIWFLVNPTSPTYSDHCPSKIVPESTPTIPTPTSTLRIPYLATSYFAGGEGLLGRHPGEQKYYYAGKYLRLRFQPNGFETAEKGIYKIDAFLSIYSPYGYYDGNSTGNLSYGGSYYRRRRFRGTTKFSLTGFWSETSRKLCMVGSASRKDENGETVNVGAVLKLKCAVSENGTILDGITSGTLESTTRHFDPIVMFQFPYVSNYNFSLVSKETVFGSVVGTRHSLSLGTADACSVLQHRSIFMELEYARGCEPHQCSPLSGDLPHLLNLNPIQCVEDGKKLRYLASFPTDSSDESFSFNSTLIGEGMWDDKNNRLFVVACRILDPISHFGSVLGECTMNLSLSYPSVLSIRNVSKIVGELWSNKTDKDPGYFRKIKLTSSDTYDVVGLPGSSYEYTEMEKVKNKCPAPKKPAKKGIVYPDAKSYDMRFDASVKNSKNKHFAWGYVTPFFVGNESHPSNRPMIVSDSVGAFAPLSAPILEPETSRNVFPVVNMSYKISINHFPGLYSDNSSSFLNTSLNPLNVEITSEGLYSVETGNLCMVGCRKLLPNLNSDTTDCEILVQFSFVPLSGKGGNHIKGTISSTRSKDDHLYFEPLSLFSTAVYTEAAEQSMWRMDLEIILVLISNTLSCIFVIVQIFHLKRNPEVVSCISLLMLLILCVGHMIPLVLNFEAMFLGNHNKQTLYLSSGGWVEANEVTVRLIALAAFLLLIRLVQSVWTAKQGEGNDKNRWDEEKKATFVSLPLYFLGALFTLLLNWLRNRYGYETYSPYGHQKHSLWGDLRSYAGLVLDGFLMPQIVLNAIRGSTEKALSHTFYMGTSAVRLVPHAYNQYRVHNYQASYNNGTYYYANPSADFYSTAWDVVIPFGVIAFAVAVFLQQRRGGRCVLPRRLRELELYTKVPVVNN